MDLAALARAGAAMAPAPQSDQTHALRARLDRAYIRAEREREAVESGRRSWDGVSLSGELRRARAGAYGPRFRCYSCKRLGLHGPEQTCGSCGYAHGGANHRAEPIR